MIADKSPDIGTFRLAEACLDFLVSDPDQLVRFMSGAGLDPDVLRAEVRSPALARGLLDYFAHDESALTALCAHSHIPVEDFMRAYYRLNPDG